MGSILSVVGFLTSAFAMLQVYWTTHAETSISVLAGDRQEEIQECLDASLEARLRFEVRLCHRRSMWLDGCEEQRSELHTVKYDEITESYRLVSERYKDELEPTAVGIPAKSEAIRMAITLKDMPLTFLAREKPELLKNEKAYVQVRTIFVCRGSVNRTLAHLSRILTLGLVNAVEDRSSWSDFHLYTPSKRAGVGQGQP